jgi:hypothetical protein
MMVTLRLLLLKKQKLLSVIGSEKASYSLPQPGRRIHSMALLGCLADRLLRLCFLDSQLLLETTIKRLGVFYCLTVRIVGCNS